MTEDRVLSPPCAPCLPPLHPAKWSLVCRSGCNSLVVISIRRDRHVAPLRATTILRAAASRFVARFAPFRFVAFCCRVVDFHELHWFVLRPLNYVPHWFMNCTDVCCVLLICVLRLCALCLDVFDFHASCMSDQPCTTISTPKLPQLQMKSFQNVHCTTQI